MRSDRFGPRHSSTLRLNINLPLKVAGRLEDGPSADPVLSMFQRSLNRRNL